MNISQSISIRAVVIGDKGTGKSSLMAQISDSYINENLEYERRITDPKLENEVLVQFSDRPEELVNAKACFLIVDLSNYNSFEFIKTIGYPKALKEIPKDGFMYLIGNKCDLDDKRHCQLNSKSVIFID